MEGCCGTIGENRTRINQLAPKTAADPLRLIQTFLFSKIISDSILIQFIQNPIILYQPENVEKIEEDISVCERIYLKWTGSSSPSSSYA